MFEKKKEESLPRPSENWTRQSKDRPIRTCVGKLDTLDRQFHRNSVSAERTIIISKTAVNYALKMNVARRFIANIFPYGRQANGHVRDETLRRRDNWKETKRKEEKG